MSIADFIEMTTTSIAGTLGNGAVTCIAATGLPTFTQAFGSGNRAVNYVIEDTVNLYFEKGYGTIAAGVLTRTNVHETWDGTTYTSVNATAFQFGSTPTSGNVRIRLAPTSDTFMPAPPAIQNTIGASTYKAWQVSGHMNPAGTPSPGGALGNTLEYYVPYLSLTKGKIDGFALEISTLGTTGIKAAFYDVGTDGLPGPCITQFNEIINTTTGFKTDTTPGTWAVNAGPLRFGMQWGYIGFMCNDTACIIKRVGTSSTGTQSMAQNPLGFRSDGYGFNMYVSKTIQGTYAGGMPTGTPAGTYSVFNGAAGLFCPLVYLRINN